MIKVIDTDRRKLIIIEGEMIQIQIEQDEDEAFIDLSRKEARNLIAYLFKVLEPYDERVKLENNTSPNTCGNCGEKITSGFYNIPGNPLCVKCYEINN
jgi:hypothetical protein